MKTKNIILIAITLGCFCFSCNDFLTEYSQDQAYVRSYTDLDELLAGDVYMKCYTISYDYGSTKEETYYPYVHFMADETQMCTSSTETWALYYAPYYLFGYYTWQQKVAQDFKSTEVWPEVQDWRNLYKGINLSSLVLSLIDEQPAETEADRLNVQRIKGEAYFLRAAYYFTLVNLYGQPYSVSSANTDLGVPLKLDAYIEDKIYERATVAEVYDQVIEDLLEAEKLLEGIQQKSIFRANHTAVCLLLSRVYLYMENYEECLKWAKVCVEEQPDLINLASFSGTDFLSEDSPEIIFSMGSNHLPTNITTASSYNPADMFMVSEDLFKCYGPGDYRVPCFVSESGGIYSYEKAHYAYGSTIEISDNFTFRTAEAYLNLAEAAACLGDAYTAEALNALNTLRQNRIANYSAESGLSGRALVDAVRLERRKELCLEGHRWFDLRRYMVNELYPEEHTLTNEFVSYEYSSATGAYEPVFARRYTLPPHDGAWTLPIPADELDANFGMPDNERGPRDYVEL